MVSKFWNLSLSICCGAVKVFLKTSCTQRVPSPKKIILQTSIVDLLILNLTVYQRACSWEGNWWYAHWNEASSLLHRGSKVLFESARFLACYNIIFTLFFVPFICLARPCSRFAYGVSCFASSLKMRHGERGLTVPRCPPHVTWPQRRAWARTSRAEPHESVTRWAYHALSVGKPKRLKSRAATAVPKNSKNDRLPGGAFTLARHRLTSSGPGHQDLSTSRPPASRSSVASPASQVLATQSTKTAPQWWDAGGATCAGKPATSPAERWPGSMLGQGDTQQWQRDCILPSASSSVDKSLGATQRLPKPTLVIVGSVKTRKYSTFRQLASSGMWHSCHIPDEANWRNVEYFQTYSLRATRRTASSCFHTSGQRHNEQDKWCLHMYM